MPPVKILAIEKDPEYREMLSEVLESSGYVVDVVDRGEDALKMIKKNSYALLILNVELPDINGYALCKKIRTDKNSASIPLILTSENSTNEDFEKHRKLRVRADDYILKPYTDDQILRKVENLTGLKIKEEELLAFQEKFEELLNEKTELERTLKDYEEIKSSLENRIEDLSEKIKNLEGEIDKYKKEGEEKNLKINDLEKKLKELNDENSQLKEEIKKVAEKLKNLVS